MPPDQIHAPWRMDYIRSLDKSPAGSDACFLCEALRAGTDAERAARFVLWTSEQSIVLMNLYPYTNGHLLIAPKAHKPELEQLTQDETLDLQVQTIRCVQLLKRAISPQGFNIGINLGRCAGAGLPGHVHQHVVPRWSGDVNYMTVIGDIRVVPQALRQLYDELMQTMSKMESEG